MSKHLQCRVYGLDCAEEVAVIERELGSKNGILKLEFDLINGRVSVSYDPHVITAEKILTAIDTTGMKAVPWHQSPVESEFRPWQRHGRAVMTATSGLLLLAGFTLHWVTQGSLIEALAARENASQAVPAGMNLLYLAAVVTGGWFVFPKAMNALRRFQPDMNLLMVIAVVGAIILEEWFEAGTVSFLFALSLLLEQWSIERARRAIRALMNISPTRARYICPHDGDVMEKVVEEVPVGVTVIVRPGEKIPLDGQVTKGNTTVNQAAITGESMPVAKSVGDIVFAGTINEDGAIEFRATKASSDTTLARIIHMVEMAQSRRAQSQQWVDRFARWYTPATLAFALLIAFMPPLLGLGSWSDWVYRGLVILVIACPCALVIATPVSIVSALTSAARKGVLVKGGTFLEAAANVRVLALDKTGTLTYGKPEVQTVVALNGYTSKELLAHAAGLEANSAHPLARAILRSAQANSVTPLPTADYRAIRGKGGEGRIGGRMFWIGSHRMMHEKQVETPEIHQAAVEMEDSGHTIVVVGNQQHVCGLIGIADSLREDAPEAVRRIHEAGIRMVVMLTGDNESTAKAVAAITGIEEYRAQLLPEDKVHAIRSLRAKYGSVAMVGEGINDAPALATADLSIAMGGMGTDAAIETADIALMSDDLTKIAWLIQHARRTLFNIKSNIAFALGLKLMFIMLAMLGVATLWMAIAADMGATLLVVLNALHLLRR